MRPRLVGLAEQAEQVGGGGRGQHRQPQPLGGGSVGGVDGAGGVDVPRGAVGPVAEQDSGDVQWCGEGEQVGQVAGGLRVGGAAGDQ
jgi:hypothetical protein